MAKVSEVTSMPDSKEDLGAEIAALEAEAEQAIIEGKQRLSRLSARLADLKRRLARFQPNTKQ